MDKKIASVTSGTSWPGSKSKQVDSFRYAPLMTKTLMRGWYPKEPAREIPWTPLKKPLAECRVAMISTAGLALANDEPFDQQGERERPWWGDPGFRRIPRDTSEVRSYHLHINTRHAEEDLNSVLPLQRLLELESEGRVGSSAATHYSFMGYILDPGELLEQTTPAIIEGLREEQVDVVLLVPV
jgi:D-proline reductase (dithiol) PrdB